MDAQKFRFLRSWTPYGGISMKSCLRNFFFLLFCSSFLMVGCSDDEGEGDGGNGGNPAGTSGTSSPFAQISASNENMPSAGMIIAQYTDAPGGMEIGKLVDNDPSTLYATGHSSFYVTWNGSKTLAMHYYSLTSSDKGAEYDPKSWTLSGSTDNKSWTVLDKQTNQTFSGRMETKGYEFENEVGYKYYKLTIEDNNGAASTYIAEWCMEGGTPTLDNIDDLMVKADGFSDSDKTPMGTGYENARVATEEDIEWLADPANDPPLERTGFSTEDIAKNGFRYEYKTVTLYPFGEPLPADVNQHSIGDCCMLAVFGSMAYIYPEFVKAIIKDNGDYTYTVSMYDPKGEPVYVTVSSQFMVDGNGNPYGCTGKNNAITWASVLEKAIMKYDCIYQTRTHVGGIATEHVAPLFTGNGSSFAFAPGKLTNDELARAVRTCLREGKLVVGGFHESDLPIGEYKTVTAHAYTFMHSAVEGALCAMRNPWGSAPTLLPGVDGGKDDGVLTVPDDDIIPPSIDLRIMEPGVASRFGDGVETPYIPPVFKSRTLVDWILPGQYVPSMQ